MEGRGPRPDTKLSRPPRKPTRQNRCFYVFIQSAKRFPLQIRASRPPLCYSLGWHLLHPVGPVFGSSVFNVWYDISNDLRLVFISLWHPMH